MKFLIASDLHGKITAYQHFADLLKVQNFDAGIIAGDLLDDGVPDEEMEEIFQNTELTPDDFIPELQLENESTEEFMDRQLAKLHSKDDPYVRANQYKEKKLRDLLCTAGKPIYVICGNHDQTEWLDGNCIYNIHNKRIKIGKWNIVGYRWTKLDRDEKDHIRDLKYIKRLTNSKTILVTHEPPFGIMDLGSYSIFEKNPESNNNGPIGSKYILKLTKQKKPKVHIFGHVHSQFGILGNSINAAYPHRTSFISLDVDNMDIDIIEEQ